MTPPPSLLPGPVAQPDLAWWQRSRALFLAAFLLVAVVAASAHVVDVVARYRHVEERAVTTSGETAAALAAATDALIGQHVRVVETVADALFQARLDPTPRRRLLQSVRERFPEMDGIIVLEASGRVVDADDQVAQLIGLDLSDRAYYQEIANGASRVVGDLVLSKASGIASVPIAVAGRSGEGKLLGLVVLGVRSAVIGRHLQLRLSGGAFPVLVDRSGRVVFHGAAPDLPWERRDYRGLPPIGEALAGRTAPWTGYRSPVTQEPRLGAVVPVPGLGWAVGVLQPVERALAPARAERRRALASGATVVLLATTLALLLGVWLSGAVAALARAVRALAEGDLGHRIQVRWRNELGWLGHAFNDMAARLEAARRQERELQDELTSANEDLQANVVQLEESMAELEASREEAQASEAEVRTLATQLAEHVKTLDAERSRFEAVLRQMPAGLVVAEAPAGRIVLSNAKAAEILGTTALPEEHADLERLSAASADGTPAADWPLTRSLRTGEVVTDEELAIRRFDGSPAVLRFSAAPIRDREGEIVAGVATFGDITQGKELERALRSTEEQLRQAQKMEAVGMLAGGVAHDFNNLLTAITGYTELLLRETADDRTGKDLAEIRTAAERAAGLTRQLLAFSRQQVFESRILDLNSVVAGMEKMLGRLIGEDVELVSHLEAGLAAVKADQGQLEQVILNLAVNARDAMPDGGKLTIETANVILDAAYAGCHFDTEPGPYVMLAVSDTGCGMPPEVQRRMFEPFFTTKEPGKGTGLGLATVYGIVKQNAGNIWVYSEPGKGTTFKVYLPRANEQSESTGAATRPAPARRGAGETVLLVEDEQAVRALARRVLEEAGYRVLEARDGEEALEISETHEGTIALMLTDVVMPGTSGPDLAARLAEHRPDLRVVYMSGYTDRAARRRQLLKPGTPFLNKPFTPDALADKVREALDSSG